MKRNYFDHKKIQLRVLAVLVFAFGIFASVPSWSQSKEKTLADIQKKNEAYKTIISSCTQVKTMKGMKKNVTIQGTMYFVRENNQMKMQFTNHKANGKEKGSQLIINGDKVVQINGGARNVFNTKSDHNMKLLQQTLLFCIKGQVNEAAKVNKSEVNMKVTDKYYVFDIDVAKNTKGRWNHLEASYSKKDMSLCILKLEEKNGNTTTYNTLDKEFNGVISKDMFNY
ncbi:MAG: outer membrane lipoprotein carrier protein LolA [Bacteroidales bacterium]|nr:outer membrane lipoprotein carrier protein LolA [Bacteroidales bacterium]